MICFFSDFPPTDPDVFQRFTPACCGRPTNLQARERLRRATEAEKSEPLGNRSLWEMALFTVKNMEKCAKIAWTRMNTAIFMRKRRKTALVFICLIFFWWTSEFILRVWRWTYCHSNIVFLFGWTLGDFRLKPATWEFCSKSWGLTV